jgi:phage terminase Nu1 subunit (DNA packaging protein)
VSKQYISKLVKLGAIRLDRNGLLDPKQADRALGRTHDQRDAPESYYEARQRKESALARLRELEVQTREGALVEREAVNREAFTVGRQIRDQLLNIPDRLAGVLVSLVLGEADKIKAQQAVHTQLTAEIRKTVQGLTG